MQYAAVHDGMSTFSTATHKFSSKRNRPSFHALEPLFTGTSISASYGDSRPCEPLSTALDAPVDNSLHNPSDRRICPHVSRGCALDPQSWDRGGSRWIQRARKKAGEPFVATLEEPPVCQRGHLEPSPSVAAQTTHGAKTRIAAVMPSSTLVLHAKGAPVVASPRACTTSISSVRSP